MYDGSHLKIYMAKIEKSKSGNKTTPKGTMPADKLKRFKLLGNSLQYDRLVCRNAKAVAKNVREFAAYRTMVHGVIETKLPASLKYTAHYFCIPMSRSDSDNPRDRKGLENVGTAPQGVLV
jgi:hypothetical protein